MYFKKTTIKVSPRHPEMRDFIERIPEVFEQEGQCVYIGRNVIKAFWIKVNGEDKEVMVKRYRQPYFVQRIHYTLFRPAKACRAYEYSFKLQANGFATPEGYGYVETRIMGLLKYCYFISDVEHSPLLSEQLNELKDFNKVMASDFARFVNRLHQKGIVDLDLNSSNIFYQIQDDGHYRFSPIDINRMKFYKGYPPLKICVENLMSFTGRIDLFEFVIQQYMNVRGINENVIRKILEAKKVHDRRWKHIKGFTHLFKWIRK